MSRSGRRLSIQKFIVSHATSLGFATCVEHVELQPRIDVAEKDERRVAELLGNLRPEVREDAEVRLERFGDVEIVAVAAAPAERRALGVLEPREVDRRVAKVVLERVDRDSRCRRRRRAARATRWLADAEKNVPEPPSTLSALPNGVSTESSATEPTTRTVIECF